MTPNCASIWRGGIDMTFLESVYISAWLTGIAVYWYALLICLCVAVRAYIVGRKPEIDLFSFDGYAELFRRNRDL